MNLRFIIPGASLILTLVTAVSCQHAKSHSSQLLPCHPEKIAFRWDVLDEDGLAGPPGGKVSLDYEFCLPKLDRNLQEILAIDTNIRCEQGPGGRIGCGNEEYLCIGNTGFQDYNAVLCQLSTRDDIQRIERTWWE